ncbi:MAG: efflux RND transporter periplasmic adaptor subunit [Acidobacteriaceae bacterium]
MMGTLRRGKKRLRGMVPLMVLAALASGCSKQEAVPTPVVQVQVVTVTPQSITQHVTGDAVLAPVAQAAISPKVTAPVRKFYVMRGSKVRKGQLLAVLDNADLQAAALDAKGSYEQAQAAYNTAVKALIPADLQTAKLNVEQAKANLNVAQQVYDSRHSLFQQGAIPGREVDTAKASLVQAQSADDIAKAHFAAFQSVSHADALKAAAGQLASAQGKYEDAEAQLAFSEIRSPIDGVVTERPLYAGETAPAGTPLITVMDVSTLLAKTHLPEAQVQLLKVGQPASVTVEGNPRLFAGTVSLVSPALDPGSTTIEVWVKVPNKSGQLKAGAPARVSIESRTVKDALVVPKEAVLTDPAGGHMVMVVEGGIAHQRKVKTGITDGERVQVVSGLKAGERIVTSGAYAMADGTRVKIVPAANAGAGKQDASQPGEGD